jgi:hypothetical protein
MRITRLAASLFVALSVASCNENQPPQPARAEARPSFLQSLQQGNVTYSGNVAANQVQPSRDLNLSGIPLNPNAPVEPKSSEPPITIPADARWTLYCASMNGPDRVGRMNQLKAYLKANTSLRDWYTVDQDGTTTLFHGFYTAIEKSENASIKAHRDRNAIAEWKDQSGARPFAMCFFTPITPPDPVAPAEWNLTNAPPRAYWSVQIAAFKDNPQRKQAAVEAVRELREKKIEAYYYHSDTISHVCVGSWPANAVKEQDVDKGEAVNPDDAVLVSSDPLPAKYGRAKLRTDDGQRLVSYSQRIEIIDPSLLATMREYPYHSVNYKVFKREVKGADGKMHEVIDPSFLVVIKREDPSMLNGGGVADFLKSSPPPMNANRPTGGAKLRGIND